MMPCSVDARCRQKKCPATGSDGNKVFMRFICYHSSDVSSPVFRDDKYRGIHFGTRQAALERRPDGCLGRYSVEIKRPLFIDRDFDWENRNAEYWTGPDDDIWFNDTDVHYWLSQNGFDSLLPLRDAVAGRGYDGIVYTNQVEDPGSLSVLVFSASQVKRIP